MRDIPITTDAIDLAQLLKVADLVGSGGEAKLLIQQSAVQVNGVIETRRRRTLRPGDVVSIAGGDSARVVRRAEPDGPPPI